MSELLDDLIAATGRSLERANEQLSEAGAADSPEISYVVTDLELSIPFGGLVLKDDRLSVELPDPDSPGEGAHYVRFAVRSIPATAAKPAPSGLPEVTGKNVDEGLTDLIRAGVTPDSVRVKFDPDSQLPAGSIADVSVAKPDDGDPSRVTLTVAGKEPGPRDRTPSGPGGGGTPLEQVRGVGPRLAAQLASVGIHNVEDLSTADPDRIAVDVQISVSRAAALVATAKELLG